MLLAEDFGAAMPERPPVGLLICRLCTTAAMSVRIPLAIQNTSLQAQLHKSAVSEHVHSPQDPCNRRRRRGVRQNATEKERVYPPSRGLRPLTTKSPARKRRRAPARRRQRFRFRRKSEALRSLLFRREDGKQMTPRLQTTLRNNKCFTTACARYIRAKER